MSNTIVIAGIIDSPVEAVSRESKNGNPYTSCSFLLRDDEFAGKKLSNSFNCIAFGKTAERLGNPQWFGEGKVVIVTGRIIQENGKQSVHVEKADFAPYAAKREHAGKNEVPSIGDDDIPF